MENDNGGSAQKDQMIETVIDIFVRVTGFIERQDVSRATNPAKDFHIDTDDLSLFIAKVEEHFKISAPQSEWFSIDGTIESLGKRARNMETRIRAIEKQRTAIHCRGTNERRYLAAVEESLLRFAGVEERIGATKCALDGNGP